jgi:hypothetical protein
VSAGRHVVSFLAALAATSVVACTDVPTDADAVSAIQFSSLPAPSIVGGDSLRDSTGAPVRLSAIAFNFDGDEIAGAPFTFFSPDTLIEISEDGFVTSIAPRDTPAKIFATLGSLQSRGVDLPIVARPDTVRADGAPDTLRFGATGSDVATVRTSDTVRVAVEHRVTGTTTFAAVPFRLVDFRLVHGGIEIAPGDSTVAHLVDENGRASVIDTTGTDGRAFRFLRVRRASLAASLDSIIVLITTRVERGLVPGAPVRIVLPVRQP